MKKTYKNVLLGLLALGMLAGCASKSEVEYKDSKSETTEKSTSSTASETVDSNAKGIAGDKEVAVSSDKGYESSVSGASYDSASGRYRVTSEINGHEVVLESVHFAFDKFNLTDTMREVATANSSKIDNTIQSYNNLKIKLEGNCDEWGTDEYNYALGLKRAKTSKDALIADGIDASRILMVSFGESNPVCTEKNVGCWKMNRRVDYRLLP